MSESTCDGQDVLDRLAIEEVCVRYARALDRRDWPLLRTCFVPDVVVEYGDAPAINSYEGVERVCRGALDPLDASQHLVSNFTIAIAGDEATSECYLQAQHVRRGVPGGELYVVAGTYTDRLRRRAGQWHIEHRRLDVVWTDGNAAVLGG